MKRKDEHIMFIHNLRILTEDYSNSEKEQAKANLIELLQKDRPLVLSMIRHGEFYDKMAKRIYCRNINDIFNNEIRSYQLPSYEKTMLLIREKAYLLVS